MIFATVGTQLPFDRLVGALDQWASRNPHEEIFAQIGQAGYVPENLEWARTISADLFRSKLEQSHIVVAHAGMGTIISALEIGKSVVVLPRSTDLGEHRNDHQIATADRLRHLNGIEVADDCESLMQLLDDKQGTAPHSNPTHSRDLVVSDTLLTRVRSFAGLVAS
jgi:UDP-N-acetylglucosamine transferase subunit ALG13